MKREKFILQPGKICTIDKNNVFKQGPDGLVYVEIVKKTRRYKLFGPMFYMVKGALEDTDKLKQPIEVPATILSPAGMSVIRYPSDIPTINAIDLDAMMHVIQYLTDANKCDFMKLDTEKKLTRRVIALTEKLRFYISLSEV